MWEWLPVAAEFVGNILGNESNEDINSAQMAFNREEAQKTRDFNSAEAEKSRKWQEEMSNSQYQRSVSDMTAAGLNPMLAYMKGGAGTPSGATASGGSASAGSLNRMNNVFDGISNSAATARLINAQVQKAEAEAENVQADTAVKLATEPNVRADTDVKVNSAAKVQADTALSRAEAEKIAYQAADILQDIEESRSRVELNSANQKLVSNLTGKAAAETSESYQRATLYKLEGILKSAQHVLTNAQADKVVAETAILPHTLRLEQAKSIIEYFRIAKERNLSEAEQTDFKRKISPFLKDAGEIFDMLKLFK